jgi:hypothetical protein
MTNINILGYSADTKGYSGVFSWWRSKTNRNRWYVSGYGPFTRGGYAITNDFGDLVEVA